MTNSTLENLTLEPNTSYTIGAPAKLGRTRAIIKAVAILAIQLDALNQNQVIRFVSDEQSPVDLANLFQKEITERTGKSANEIKTEVFFSSKEAKSKEKFTLMLNNNQYKKHNGISTAFDVLVLDVHSNHLSDDEILKLKGMYDIEIIQSVQTAMGTESTIKPVLN